MPITLTPGYYILAAFLTAWLLSCNRLIPSAYWRDFNHQFLKETKSDNGPYGGSIAMNWESKNTEIFTSEQILDFAKKYGWVFIDSTNFSAKAILNWTLNHEDIFSLNFTGFHPQKRPDDNTFNMFPRWIKDDIILYRFKTQWVTVQPGSDSTYPAYGYIIVNTSKNEMSVYHLWGD